MKENLATEKSEELLRLGLSYGIGTCARILRREPPQRIREEWPKAVSMGMFAAALKSYKSLAALIRGGFEESAAVIGRTILDLSLQTRFLQLFPDRIEDYVYWSDFNRFRMIRRCKRNADEQIRSIADAAEEPNYAERYADLEAHFVEHKHRYKTNPQVWHGLNTRELSDKCGIEAQRDYAIMYWHHSNLGHANPTGMEHYVKVDTLRNRIKLRVDPSRPENDIVAWRATQNFFFVLYFVNETWGLGLDIERGDRQLYETMQQK